MKESKFSGCKPKLLLVFIFMQFFALKSFAQNDNCANALPITPSSTAACGTMGLAAFAGATASPESSICAPAGGPDIWFQFVASSAAHDISLLNFPATLNQPVYMALYEGNVCGSLISRYCSANNYISATGLIVGTTYKIRLSLAPGPTNQTLSFSVCVNTPLPPTTGANPLECFIKTVNPGFEQPTVAGMEFVRDYTMQGWRTTATDHFIEVWTNGYVDVGGTNLPVPSYEGNQYVELNANQTSGLYQDYVTPQATVFTYSFAHRGRRGVDRMRLLAGPPGNLVQIAGPFATGNTAWQVYTGTYTVPAGQPITRFVFEAVSTATGDTSVGNFLDAISFTANNGIITSSPHYVNCSENFTNISATGVGSWTASPGNPPGVTIANPGSQNTLVSGFVTPGTYHFDWSTSYCSSTLEVIYYGTTPPPPVVQNVTYCIGQTAAPLSNQAQALPGFSLVWANGSTPTPDTSVISSTIYGVLQVSAGNCESIFVPIVVTVKDREPQVTDFTIPASVCSTSANVIPTPAPNFATGGQYTGNNGLVINGTTGEINVVASGPGTYAVTYAVPVNVAGCLAASSNTENITITNFAETLDTTYQQPTCAVATGAITINTPTGAGFAYSINGTTFQPGTTFAGLAPGSYTITVQNPSGCVSSFPGRIINAQPASPVIATVTTVQPTCPAPTGSITVTAPVGAGLSYSIDGTNFQLATAFTNLTPATYNVTVRNVDGCTSVLTGVVINPVPGSPAVPTVAVVQPSCTSATGTITVNTPTGANLTYSLNGIDFQTTTTFNNVVSGTYTVTVRTTGGCTSVSGNIVINTPPAPVGAIPQPAPLVLCDDNTDGFNFFDLTPRLQEIEAAMGNVTATAFATQSDANLNVLVITTPGNYYDDSGTIYIRVQSNTTGCFNTTTLQLIVNPRPANPLVGNLSLCDDNNSPDGLEIFDLTLNDAAARGNDATLVVQYYRSLLEAQGNTNPITTPAAFPNTTPNQQTIWVGVTTASGCRSIGSFSLIVNPLPVLSTDPADYIAYECEEVTNMADFNLNEIASTITEGSSAYVVYFYKTDGQARAGGPDFEPSTYQAGNSFIYARVINPSTNCIRIAEVELRVIPAPIATQPAPLSVCDENTDTFGTFNLLPTMQAIEASLSNVVVTAYETQSDADLGVIPIPNPGSYPTINPNTQTLYLRVQSTLTECYDTVTLVLIVNPRPAAVSPAAAYALCDGGVSDNDGQAVFNLNTQSAEILNGLDPAQYSIAYYTDATATALIGTPGNFVSGTATVYAKVTNNATGCFYIVPVRLVVNGLPVLITNQYSYSLCDTSGDPDREEFDLTSVIGQFITDGNRNGVSVQFYTSLAAAQAGGTGPELITGETAYTNVPPQVQSLYVRFEVMATGCYRLGYLDIRVEPQPVIEEPSAEELTVCDTNGTGIGTFDLEALKAGMANGGANLDITFHLTYEDAVSGANPIPNTTNYKNGNPYTEILYVRVVNTVSGCYNTRPYAITLHVNPAPQAPDLADITLCDDIDNNGQDGAAKTDITLYEDDIDAAVDPVDVDITYYTSEADANTPVRAIANPATYTAHDNQVIWVRVEDAAGCYSVTSFTIHFNKPHALVNPTPLALCNELLPNDGITSFDLTQKDDEILGAAGVGRGYTVEYFTANPKGNTGAVAIPDPKAFTNTTNPQVIYVRVTTKAGCVSYTSLSIKVLPLPEPNFNPAPLVLCDDDQATVGSEPFDLTDAGDDILANGDYELSYYETEEDANNKVNPIPDPTSYTSTGGVVYVRVEANTNNPAEPGCYQVVALTLRVDPLPPVADLDDLAHCEQGTDGQDTFNLLEAINTALGGNTAGEYEVEVYEDPALTTPAIPITAYEVTGGTATVYVVVESTATGCRIVKELQLYVEEAATANPVADPSPVCDTEGGNDGVVTWDLTQFDSDALGTQAPGVYQVTYHTTEQDAIDGINAIATPQAYENTPQEQVLWVRVTNTATITKCSDVTSFTLRVEIRPEPVITGEGGSNTICIDFGATEGELVLNSGVVPAGHTYQWFKGGVLLSDSDQSGEYTARTEGVYTVIVTGPAPLNCVSDTSAAFTVIKSGQASQVGKGYYVTNYFSDNQTITVNVEGNGEYTYQLDNGPRQPDPVFTNVSPGYHKVTVYDEKTDFPCQELTIDGVSIVDYPNFFTPNGDGFHDTWNIIGLSGTGSVIYIFDRYGKLIKQISPDINSDGWDGTMNGVPVPATDYWFSVTYPEFDGTTTVTKEFKSHFSLKR